MDAVWGRAGMRSLGGDAAVRKYEGQLFGAPARYEARLGKRGLVRIRARAHSPRAIELYFAGVDTLRRTYGEPARATEDSAIWTRPGRWLVLERLGDSVVQMTHAGPGGGAGPTVKPDPVAARRAAGRSPYAYRGFNLPLTLAQLRRAVAQIPGDPLRCGPMDGLVGLGLLQCAATLHLPPDATTVVLTAEVEERTGAVGSLTFDRAWPGDDAAAQWKWALIEQWETPVWTGRMAGSAIWKDRRWNAMSGYRYLEDVKVWSLTLGDSLVSGRIVAKSSRARASQERQP